ncbi:MAG TPA: peptidylprolyl isomerase [Gemmatimonadaceae bacterium]
MTASAISVQGVSRPRAERDSLDIALYAQMLQSADQRALDTVLLARALASTDAEIRRVGARTLSQVALRHRRRAIPLLRDLTHDADSAVASSAVFGLGLVRDTASVPLLASLFHTPVAESAAWALGEIGAPAANTISELLGEQRIAGHATRAASRALIIAASKIKPLDFSAVTPYLNSPDAELSWAAAYAVARQRAPSGARALLDVTNPDAAFRAELARELDSHTVGDSLRERAIARLHNLLGDADPHVRINALRSIGSFGVAARPAILRGLRDRDANVRVTAAQSAGTAFGTVASLWREAWNADTAFKVRKSLLESAANAHVTLPGDAEWRASPDWRRRDAAVTAWAASRDTLRARTIALQAARDPDGRVREAAYGLLIASDTARRDSVVQRALVAAKSDPDSIARNSIPGSHARSLDTATVDRPIAWYENAVRRVVVPSLQGHPPRATILTVRGRITITLDGVLAPLTVLNYATLADKHAYDNVRFHRVVPGFVAQDGDPRGDGEGGPGYAIRDELTLLPYVRGAVGMALSGPDTGGSQYFLTLTPQPHLTGHYTVFGVVTSGLDVMDALIEGDAINSVLIHW